MAEIDAVKDAVEHLWPLFQSVRDLIERGGHPPAVRPFGDDDHVVIVAECLEILLPPLLARLVAGEQVVALCVVFEPVVGEVDGGKRQRACEQENCARSAYHAGDETGDKPGDKVRLRDHGGPSPSEFPWDASEV